MVGYGNQESGAMKTISRHWPLLLLGVLAFAAFAFLPLSGCVASGGAYVSDGAYVGDYDYYGAPGYVVYEGWGPTYRVGPPRGDHDHHDVHQDDHHDNHGSDGHQGHTAYRPAPSSRRFPRFPRSLARRPEPPGKTRGEPPRTFCRGLRPLTRGRI